MSATSAAVNNTDPAGKAAEADTIVFSGGKPLMGSVEVRGAKNLVTKAMVAALLGDEPSVLNSVPAIRDVAVVRGLLEAHAVDVTDSAPGQLTPAGVATDLGTVAAQHISHSILDYRRLGGELPA